MLHSATDITLQQLRRRFGVITSEKNIVLTQLVCDFMKISADVSAYGSTGTNQFILDSNEN